MMGLSQLLFFQKKNITQPLQKNDIQPHLPDIHKKWIP